MQLIVELSGAEKAMIFCKENDETYQLKASATSQNISVYTSGRNGTNKNTLPIPLIYYVTRSKQFLFCQDVKNDSRFHSDSYFQHNDVYSILGYPVLKNDVLIGIIYLENSQQAGVINPETINLFKSLSFHIGISLGECIAAGRTRKSEIIRKRLQ